MPRRTATDSLELLESVYEGLGYGHGRLLSVTASPRDVAYHDWVAAGDWLTLAARFGADKILFVGDDPVLVFATVPDSADEVEFTELYRQAWSLARPRFLFAATSGELRVYALSQPPVSPTDRRAQVSPLEVVQASADVASELQQFRIENIEAGTFPDTEVDNKRNADEQLIRDVSFVAQRLREAGLTGDVAHSLIERVILIRYLEDRDVLTRDFLYSIASERPSWTRALGDEPDELRVGANSAFVNCLNSKSLSYAVFRALEAQFNGDLFSVSAAEISSVNSNHLSLLRRCLVGDLEEGQRALFLWAYAFDIIPTSLISSMYENFYHSSSDQDERSTHYTPPELVEYVLRETVAPDRLENDPRIIDPACGSGVFLVEAFRLLVRHRMKRLGRRLSTKELRDLLVTRVAGVDLNLEAVRLAAFALYVAYLNYQTARDIRAAGPLPRLIYDPERRSDASPVLVVADAFDPLLDEERSDLLPVKGLASSELPWPRNNFDIVIGNPPWDEPSGSKVSTAGELWAKAKRLPVGDRNPCQLFLWRTTDYLSTEGVAGMLIGASAFVNDRPATKLFRQRWLSEVTLYKATNFARARRLFFARAVAPFFFVSFGHPGDGPHRAIYGSVAVTPALERSRAMSFALISKHFVMQSALIDRDYLWKLYGWGSRRDDSFMARLGCEESLGDHLHRRGVRSRWGYQRGARQASAELANLPSIKDFDPWGSVKSEWLESPASGVKRQPDPSIYSGRRLLVRRGVKSGFGPFARLETRRLAFRHTTYCVPLGAFSEEESAAIFLTMLSSLGRYHLFMTSGSWGLWHDSILASDILALPIRLPTKKQGARAASLASQIAAWEPARDSDLFGSVNTAISPGLHRAGDMPTDLLEAVDDLIFDLFDLGQAERDLVQDWLTFVLPSIGVTKTQRLEESRAWTSIGAPSARIRSDLLDTYAQVFEQQWRPVGSEALSQFDHVYLPSGDESLLAAIFQVDDVQNSVISQTVPDLVQWQQALDRLGAATDERLGRRIATDGVMRAVSESFVIIVKRNLRRNWSPSAARDDAEASIARALGMLNV